MKDSKPISHKRKMLYTYLILAVSLLLIAAVTLTLVFALPRGDFEIGTDTPPNVDNPDDPDLPEQPNPPAVDTSSSTTWALPVSAVSVMNGYTFYKNITLNCYHLHSGVDFAGEVGEQVFAVLDGEVQEITTDILNGTTLTLRHKNGLVTSYSFIDAREDLSVGDIVAKGQMVGTIASPTGNEYKEGAHLHFEILENGKAIDPELYLDLSIK